MSQNQIDNWFCKWFLKPIFFIELGPRFEESGVKDRMWANWTYVAAETFWEEDIEPIDEVIFSFPAFILVAGMLLSLIFLLFEKIGGSGSAGRSDHHEGSGIKKFAP